MLAGDPSAFTMALGTLGPALAIGMIGAAALMGMARNPQNSDRIQVAMIIAIAFAEAIAIYALVVALILKFVG
jgi:F-type H+-transporting ATPase subunit c